MFSKEVAERLVKDESRAGHWLDPLTEDVYNAPGFTKSEEAINGLPSEPVEEVVAEVIPTGVDEVPPVEASGEAVAEAGEDDDEDEFETVPDPRTGSPIEQKRRRGRPRKDA